MFLLLLSSLDVEMRHFPPAPRAVAVVAIRAARLILGEDIDSSLEATEYTYFNGAAYSGGHARDTSNAQGQDGGGCTGTTGGWQDD